MIRNKFQVFLSQGCFDIAAKKEHKMLIKASFNIDGLSLEHALSLKALSYFISAYPLIISVKTNRKFLDNRIIYSRFQIPVITPKMFELLIENGEIPSIEASRGKHLVAIDCEILKKKREELGLSLKELSKIVGISKKALYEIENRRVSPTLETVEKLERVLKTDLKKSFRFKKPEPTYLKPKNSFQRIVSEKFEKIGIENSYVYSAPFEMVGKMREVMLARFLVDISKIEKYSKDIKALSDFFSSRAIFVVKNFREENVEGIPVFSKEEIEEIENLREFEKIFEEKINR